MPKLTHRVPAYRKHKAKGTAVVTLNGKNYYLGTWNSPESKTEYKRLITEWLAAGKTVVVPASDLTCVELGAAYILWATDYYRRDGEPTRSLERTTQAMKELGLLHGLKPVAEFGPLALMAIQARLAEDRETSEALLRRIQTEEDLKRSIGADRDHAPILLCPRMTRTCANQMQFAVGCSHHSFTTIRGPVPLSSDLTVRPSLALQACKRFRCEWVYQMICWIG